MNHTTAIKFMMNRSRLTQSRLGAMLGVKRAAVGNRINYHDMSLRRMLQITEACGYEVVLQPTTQGKRREGQLVLKAADYERSDTE